MAERQPARPGRAPGPDHPVRITTAPTSPREDMEQRRRRYLVSMALRTACVIGAVVVGPGVLRWVLIAGAVVLPYVAVVMANAVNRKSDAFRLQPTDPGVAQLGPGEERR